MEEKDDAEKRVQQINEGEQQFQPNTEEAAALAQEADEEAIALTKEAEEQAAVDAKKAEEIVATLTGNGQAKAEVLAAQLTGTEKAEMTKAPAEVQITWESLDLDKSTVERLLLTDELTASDSPDAANISQEERSKNRIQKEKVVDALFEKTGNGTISDDEKQLLLKYIDQRAKFIHPSGFIPESARKDEDIMRTVAQASKAGANWTKDLGFTF